MLHRKKHIFESLLEMLPGIIRASTRENRSSGFPTRSDTNRPVQAQKRARSLKFWVKVEGILYYLCSENKGADQLRGYREADLRLCFRLGKNPVFSRCGSIYLLLIDGFSIYMSSLKSNAILIQILYLVNMCKATDIEGFCLRRQTSRLFVWLNSEV